jgi:hypothetical protein
MALKRSSVRFRLAPPKLSDRIFVQFFARFGTWAFSLHGCCASGARCFIDHDSNASWPSLDLIRGSVPATHADVSLAADSIKPRLAPFA